MSINPNDINTKLCKLYSVCECKRDRMGDVTSYFLSYLLNICSLSWALGCHWTLWPVRCNYSRLTYSLDLHPQYWLTASSRVILENRHRSSLFLLPYILWFHSKLIPENPVWIRPTVAKIFNVKWVYRKGEFTVGQCHLPFLSARVTLLSRILIII